MNVRDDIELAIRYYYSLANSFARPVYVMPTHSAWSML